ncbi:DUF934 domain-containing protein [Psychrobacter sp. AOP22-C1-22]|uniref:DUF934 domain-containing protein n=1 Tax=unclassified Psychrobacter TaxID=196806 RepID=UPI001787A466|nr:MULTISPECIES: DUF934 domain-containing protein [unclassified Psychrobacter]MBE0405388.1 DUF934 domain-containing protein [Psychrobacter sp. FME6]MBE0443702.1 DUF934 domain-containing protein [Psychrobacter sp. FME5]MDN5800898.1 DUF934 domain-containing protein [Psychrobacter sp.]MDN5891176.1 DUF934 domain-containing protein [Psychrobacter sp.]
MANHHVLNEQGADIGQNDTWLALSTNELPDGIALTHISLLELLQKQEKLDVLLPLSDLLDAKGNIAGGLLQQVRELLAQHTSRFGVWVTSDSDTEVLTRIPEFLLQQDLIVIHVPAFTDGRGFSFAQTLRQIGYQGEIRMAGEFGRDQIAYLLRAGADSFVISEHDLQSISNISQAFNALASSYDGRDASALPMFAGA